MSSLKELETLRNSLRWAASMWSNDQIEVGDFTYGRPIVHQWDKTTKLTIGKFCSIAGNVHILLGGEHHTNFVTTYPFDVLLDNKPTPSKGDVTIGNDVWIGENVMILSGVKIGDGAVIGAGSVVGGDVAPYSVVIGNPARLIKWRFGRPWIKTVEALRWWDWPLEKLDEMLPLLMSDNIDELAGRCGNDKA